MGTFRQGVEIAEIAISDDRHQFPPQRCLFSRRKLSVNGFIVSYANVLNV
jgi:hypothetical protein